MADIETLMYTDTVDDIENMTTIQKFYENSNIFITGGTGFLGKVLIEKLLRSCFNLNAIYVLIRNKKGKDLHSRLEEMFEDSLFERLKKERPKFRHKVVAVAGDCSLPQLGLSDHDRNILIQNITIVFHVAATVRFDEKLKMAVAINVRSPRDIFNLATKMTNLQSIIHVSTAYSNCIKNVIEEKIYPSPIDGDKLITMCEGMNDKFLDNITPSVLGTYPNTYALTKQIAESVVEKCSRNLPVGIFRPAVVISTYKEPVRGWVNNLYGPTGICAGAGTGLIRTLRADPEVNANLIPVDMCVNSLITTAWDVKNKFDISKEDTSSFEIPIYNYESSNDCPIDWKTYMEYSAKYGLMFPSVRAVWYYSLHLEKSYYLYYILSFLLHVVPAFLVDVALFCIGKKPKMVKVYKKIHKMTSVLSYFTMKNWKFESRSIRSMIERMSDEDREIFFCDLKKLNWEDYYSHYLLGIRQYLIQDSLDTLPEATVRWNRLYWLHQFTKVLLTFLFIRICLYFVSFCYNVVFT